MPNSIGSHGISPEPHHFEQLSHWLELESAAETQRLADRRKRANDANVEPAGETLLDLAITDQQSGSEHPARVGTELREYTLDVMVANHENMRWVRDLMRDAETLFRKASRYTRAKPAPGQRQEMRRQAKQLKADPRMLERQAVEHVLDQADVVRATVTFDEEVLGDRQFDLAVIDEAS